jgi:hypothetical protein
MHSTELPAQLRLAEETGTLNPSAAPAVLALLKEVYGSLAAGDPDNALAHLNGALGPVLARQQAYDLLQESFQMLLLQLQESHFGHLPDMNDAAAMNALSDALQDLVDAAEDTIARLSAFQQT